MQRWWRGPGAGIGGAIERFANGAVAGGPDQIVSFEVGGTTELVEGGLRLGFA